MNQDITIPDEVIMSKIYDFRNTKVMLDRDLAILYGVETRVLKQAVRRNQNRFPEDFMFQMSKGEFDQWRSQIVISKGDKMGLRYAPFCFTEQGVTMLACILNSDRAIAVNIRIIRTFTKMRELLLTNKELLLEMEQIKKKVKGHDEKIDLIFNYLKKLIHQNEEPRVRVGFKRKNES